MTFSVFATRRFGENTSPVLTIPDHWSFDVRVVMCLLVLSPSVCFSAAKDSHFCTPARLQPWGPDWNIDLTQCSIRTRVLDGHPFVLEVALPFFVVRLHSPLLPCLSMRVVRFRTSPVQLSMGGKKQFLFEFECLDTLNSWSFHLQQEKRLR